MASDALDMTGKVVIVTGGAKGLGRGITEAFLGRGARVVICGRQPPEALPSAAGRTAVFVPADVREITQIDALVAAVAEVAQGPQPHIDLARLVGTPRHAERQKGREQLGKEGDDIEAHRVRAQ